jgi:transcriptional regulator with XRE-family HTH domain
MAKERKSSLSMQLRKKVGLSQTSVAAALNLTELSVRRWELGIHEPKLRFWQVAKLMELYQCDLNDLMIAFAPEAFQQNQVEESVDTADKIPVSV